MKTTEKKNKEKEELFPALPLESWQSTKDTLHLYLQIVGKIHLTLAPRRNHWWNVTFRVNSRGVGTGPIPYNNIYFDINFDFINHVLQITTSEGKSEDLLLCDGLSVAEFYIQLFDKLSKLGIEVEILAEPYDLKTREPFSSDVYHHAYVEKSVFTFWKILVQVDKILKEFSGRFNGKSSPVQLFWHSFDLAVSRYSGKTVPEMQDASIANKDAYSHEVIAAGFWAGDEIINEPAFYSYTYPLPKDIEKQVLLPKAAKWREYHGSTMAILLYDDMRKSDNPRRTLLEFLESSYQAGASLAGWDIESFKVRPLV
jgi:hypothetical protein